MDTITAGAPATTAEAVRATDCLLQDLLVESMGAPRHRTHDQRLRRVERLLSYYDRHGLRRLTGGLGVMTWADRANPRRIVVITDDHGDLQACSQLPADEEH